MSNLGTVGAPERAPEEDFRTPLARARGLGSAKSGTGHWWRQRVTAVLMVILVPWLIGLLVSMVGADMDAARNVIAKPWNLIILVAFVIAAFWHAKLGLQVVIEDYVHIRWIEVTLQLLVTFACAIAALASLYALGHIAMTVAMPLH
ncbi:MAG: succinate dehydrogenase, hydrophobic membrane anchor protein [Luteimonas sp.]